MIELIKSEGIDVLLVSGDVFDHSNPTNEARKLYFELLKKIADLKIQVVITGGNHDSVNMLHASKELLSLLNITVVGGVMNDLGQQIVELQNRNNEIKAYCAAVPFLRDKDLRSFVAGESYEERIAAIKEGIYQHFRACRAYIDQHFEKKLPCIAMGHLFIQGATVSESERDIQVGNTAGVEAKYFEELFDYVALGHIHKPKRYGHATRYSGSPIPLSFSEKNHDKKVIIVTVTEDKVESKSIKVPKFRSLETLEGEWHEISEQLKNYQNIHVLQPLIELIIHAEHSQIYSIDKDVNIYKNLDFNIVKTKYKAKGEISKLSNAVEGQKYIHELNPKEVFRKKLDQSAYNEDEKLQLSDAFTLLLEEVYTI